MSRTAVTLESAAPTAPAAAARPNVRFCPVGDNCSCVFSRNQPGTSAVTTATPDPALDFEVTELTDFGWRITESHAREVVLERQLGFGFCLNLVITMFTAGIWLAAWIPRQRHPRVDVRRVTLDASGTVAVSKVIERR